MNNKQYCSNPKLLLFLLSLSHESREVTPSFPASMLFYGTKNIEYELFQILLYCVLIAGLKSILKASEK